MQDHTTCPKCLKNVQTMVTEYMHFGFDQLLTKDANEFYCPYCGTLLHIVLSVELADASLTGHMS